MPFAPVERFGLTQMLRPFVERRRHLPAQHRNARLHARLDQRGRYISALALGGNAEELLVGILAIFGDDRGPPFSLGHWRPALASRQADPAVEALTQSLVEIAA